VHEAGKPAIVIGRHEGTILFLMPFALEHSAGLRKITWLGSFLCNYNGPVLARDFSQRVSPPQFAQVWQDIQSLLLQANRARHRRPGKNADDHRRASQPILCDARHASCQSMLI
jgi:CelD/BcsL family acetyltransferase involved in cellulose biosynthesis